MPRNLRSIANQQTNEVDIIYKTGDRVRYREGVVAAYDTLNSPDRRGMIGTVVRIIEGAVAYLVIEWPDGLNCFGVEAPLFELVPP